MHHTIDQSRAAHSRRVGQKQSYPASVTNMVEAKSIPVPDIPQLMGPRQSRTVHGISDTAKSNPKR
eukprot:2511976-Rhodomonas_salina.3